MSTTNISTSGRTVAHERTGVATAMVTNPGGDIAFRADDAADGGSLRTSGGDVCAHLSGNYPLTARTSGGDIDLSTADDVSENHLSWRTSGGDVEVNGRDRSCQSR